MIEHSTNLELLERIHKIEHRLDLLECNRAFGLEVGLTIPLIGPHDPCPPHHHVHNRPAFIRNRATGVEREVVHQPGVYLNLGQDEEVVYGKW